MGILWMGIYFRKDVKHPNMFHPQNVGTNDMVEQLTERWRTETSVQDNLSNYSRGGLDSGNFLFKRVILPLLLKTTFKKVRCDGFSLQKGMTRLTKKTPFGHIVFHL